MFQAELGELHKSRISLSWIILHSCWIQTFPCCNL